MRVLRNNNISPFDVDDTLLMVTEHKEYDCSKFVTIKDPVTGTPFSFRINKPMVRLLMEELHRKSQVIIWSAGGYEWAECVVKALGLENHDILIMSKPTVYFDDKEVGDWLMRRVYFSPDSTYKNNRL